MEQKNPDVAGSSSSTTSAVDNFNEGIRCMMSEDMKQAKKYFQLAADQGLDKAQMNLGSMFRQEGDMKNALKYYQLGADQGQRECMKNVGYFYYQGLGVEKDHQKAFEWYKKAADLGKSMNFIVILFSY